MLPEARRPEPDFREAKANPIAPINITAKANPIAPENQPEIPLCRPKWKKQGSGLQKIGKLQAKLQIYPVWPANPALHYLHFSLL